MPLVPASRLTFAIVTLAISACAAPSSTSEGSTPIKAQDCETAEDCVDNGKYCDGVPICNAFHKCADGPDPCAGGTSICNRRCDEVHDNCFAAAGDPCSNDNNPCTDNICSNDGECGVPNDLVLDDGLYCNGPDDYCEDGILQHVGDPCLGGETCSSTCNEEEDNCVPALDDAVECDPDDSPCTDDICDGLGGCGVPHDNVTCHVDDNVCTDDVCQGGLCVPVNNSAECDTDAVWCNGSSVCSAGSCPPPGALRCTGTCDYAAYACAEDLRLCQPAYAGTPCTASETLPECYVAECDGQHAGSVCGRPAPYGVSCTPEVSNPCVSPICNNGGICGVQVQEGEPCPSNFCDGPAQCTSNAVCVADGNPCPPEFACNNADNGACFVRFTELALGYNFTCGLTPVDEDTSENELYCWRAQNNDLVVGAHDWPYPVQKPSGVTRFTKVVAGEFHVCALTDGANFSGKLYCWGEGDFGKLGNNDSIDQPTPVEVYTGAMPQGVPTTFVDVAAGGEHTCAITTAPHTAFCWGTDQRGQLGNGSEIGTNQARPEFPVTLAGSVSSITTGSTHSCAISSGAAYCWGEDRYGQLGGNSTYQAGENDFFSHQTSPIMVMEIDNNVSFVSGRGLRCPRGAATRVG